MFSFGPLYHFNTTTEDYMVDYDTVSFFPRNPEPIIAPCLVDEMLTHYRERVVKAQYLFADTQMRNLICDIVMSNTRSREAASLLSSVHWQRFQNPNALAFESAETQRRLLDIQGLLNQDYTKSPDGAMAALHVVSSHLFDGGGGDWEWWLATSYGYVDQLFSRYHSPSEALMRCTARDAFIIKTSIWFDVLASVTTQKVPHFLEPIRSMFDPTQSKIQELGAEDPSSMMSPMGCHNDVVWALAETSELFCWKQQELANETLSVPTLVRKATRIDEYLQPPPVLSYPSTNIDGCRHLASEIFRASARLYLRAIVSGDHPCVPEIRESVQDTINCVQFLNCPPSCNTEVNGQTMSRSVVRNTVFGFFICGAFAERSDHRELIQGLLDREGDGIGNSGSIRRLLHKIWEQRDVARRQHSSAVVNWRNELAKEHILLV
ncbi:hypothetical protein C0993_008139 [Termitomyces sp. T159_Od127]|nr:hypothetical protein C0993_008139 [Termitomyces sp. T159_Od127]